MTSLKIPRLLLDRFLPKIKSADNGCINWVGGSSRSHKKRYGTISINNKNHYVHRVIYEATFGPIPVGLVIDHVCENTLCVNPKHLEAVTNRANILKGNGAPAKFFRQTHCKHGHKMAGENLRLAHKKNGTTHRICIKCYRAKKLRWYHKNKKVRVK